MSIRLIHGDCTVVLHELLRAGLLVDAVCTDPPYHLASIVARFGKEGATPAVIGATGAYRRAAQGFQGQEWDGGDIAFQVETWRRIYDVMKPGAYLVAFSHTKGYHRMACAIEDAGFEIRDMLAWLYGAGMPKSHNQKDDDLKGLGSALKPAIEPIVFAQKPIAEGSIERNVRKWGVGALQIDAARIEAPGDQGRWPANVLHDGSDEVEEAFAAFGEKGAAAPVNHRKGPMFKSVYQPYDVDVKEPGSGFHGDSGSASRFFYSSKATTGERIYECRVCGAHTIGKTGCEHDGKMMENNMPAIRTHPTVKPASLMEWLVKLVCPPGGLVLDPFAGTGTMAAAARAAGMQSISIEADESHMRDIALRLGVDLSEIINATVAPIPVNHGDQGDMFL